MSTKTLDQEVGKLNDDLISMDAKRTGNLQVISSATDIGQYIPALGDNLACHLANIYATKSAYTKLSDFLGSHDRETFRSSELKDLVKNFLKFKRYYVFLREKESLHEKIDEWCKYFEPFGNVDSQEDYVSDTLKKRLQDIVKTNFTEIGESFHEPHNKHQKDEYIERALFLQELIEDVYTAGGAKLIPVAKALASELSKVYNFQDQRFSLSTNDTINEIEKLDKFLTENEHVKYDLWGDGFHYLKNPILKRSFFEKMFGKGNANGDNGTTWPG